MNWLSNLLNPGRTARRQRRQESNQRIKELWSPGLLVEGEIVVAQELTKKGITGKEAVQIVRRGIEGE